MEYPKEFEKLIKTTKENLIGWGNPNARILIIGKESAIPKDNDLRGKEQYEREIIKNHEFWERNKKQGISQDDVVPIQFCDGNDIIKNIEVYNPLYPYKGQLNRVRRVIHNKKGEEKIAGEKGTSKTWHNYQYLSDLIFRRERTSSNEIIDFHRFFFTSELSVITAKYSNQVDKKAREKSINVRKAFFADDYFKQFSIIVLAAGNYPERFGVNYETFWGPVSEVEIVDNPFEGEGIYKIVGTRGEQCKLFIQTYQLSMVSNALIEEIAGRIIEFKNNHSITFI